MEVHTMKPHSLFFITETLVSLGETMSLLRAVTDLATMETEERSDPSQTVDEPRGDGAADCGDNARRLAAMLCQIQCETSTFPVNSCNLHHRPLLVLRTRQLSSMTALWLSVQTRAVTGQSDFYQWSQASPELLYGVGFGSRLLTKNKNGVMFNTGSEN